jgi:hypothetical protein
MKFPKVIYKDKLKTDSWCRWSVNRVKRRNNSTNVRFTGSPGSGKSWSALYFCERCAKLMNRPFTPNDIYFSIRDVIGKVAEEEPKPGTIFFIDEQQVGASAKAHATKKNQAYSNFMSTVRSNRYIIVTTLPFSDMEDKQLRRMFHLEVECEGANLTSETVKAKPRYLEHSRINDKTYRKRLVIVYPDPVTKLTKARKLDTWDINKPSQSLIDVYEGMKREFKRQLYKKLHADLTEFEGTDETPSAVANQETLEELTEFQKAILDLMKSGIKVQKDMIPKLVEKGFNTSPQKISTNLKWMKKKGVIVIR